MEIKGSYWTYHEDVSLLTGKEVRLEFNDGSIRRAACVNVKEYWNRDNAIRVTAIVTGIDQPPTVSWR